MSISNEPQIKIKLIHIDAKVPKFETEGAAGMDFALVEDVFLPAKTTLMYPTGIIMEIPVGYELELRPRSSFALKFPGIVMANAPGTIDSDFRDQIRIILRNTTNEMGLIPKGTRIVQGIIHKVYQLKITVTNKVSKTKRGSGGFGHTGDK